MYRDFSTQLRVSSSGEGVEGLLVQALGLGLWKVLALGH